MRRHLSGLVGGILVLLVGMVGLAVASPTAPAAFSTGLWASPLELDFGPVGLGAMSAPLAVTFTNSGTSFITGFDGGGVGAPFLRANTCDTGLSPGSTCQYIFTFAPETAGDFTATSHVETDAGTIDIIVRGRGVGPRLHVSPLAFDFGYKSNSSAFPPQTATATNTGMGHLSFTEITAPAVPFSVTPNCVGGLDPGQSCPLTLNFAPTATGEYADTIQVASDGGTATISVMGRSGPTSYITGQGVSPRSIDFGPVPVGMATPEIIVTVANLSDTQHLLDFEGGDVDPPFSMTTNCIDDIDPATNCEYRYKFTPAAEGEFTATASVTNNTGSFSIELRGQGVGRSVSADALWLDFGPVAPGETSPPQAVTFRNTGPTTINNLFGGAPSPAGFGGFTTCGQPIAPGATCQFTYTFQPTEPGRYESVSVVSLSSDGAKSITIRLTGGTHPPRLSLAFAPEHIQPGEQSTLMIEIANDNSALPLTTLALAGELPEGVVLADPPNPMVGLDCGGATFQPVAGESALLFTSDQIFGGKTCVLGVDVVAAGEGIYTFETTVTSDSGESDPAGAQLLVGDVAPPEWLLYLPYVSR